MLCALARHLLLFLPLLSLGAAGIRCRHIIEAERRETLLQVEGLRHVVGIHYGYYHYFFFVRGRFGLVSRYLY